MALTSTEEALVRQLLDQQAAILALAGNESTITSKLGATKVTLADLVAVSSLADADLLLTRQGTTDKSVTAAILAQYILAELAPDFVNVSGDTMTGALALFGGDTGVTPPQFDNDTSLATTAFVQRALGNTQGQMDIAANTILAPGDVGKIIAPNASGLTVTLPSSSEVPFGSLVFVNANGQTVGATIAPQGSDVIIRPDASSGSVALNSIDFATFRRTSIGWTLENCPAALRFMSPIFGSSLAASGYQKLPSGFIIQWDSIPSAASATTNALFPITFPGGAPFQVLASGYNISGGVQAYVTVNDATASGCAFNAFYANTGGVAPYLAGAGDVLIKYIAIGK